MRQTYMYVDLLLELEQRYTAYQAPLDERKRLTCSAVRRSLFAHCLLLAPEAPDAHAHSHWRLKRLLRLSMAVHLSYQSVTSRDQ